MPAIFGIMALGVIGLFIFMFFAVFAGFFGGLVMFLFNGKQDYAVWSRWWIIITGAIIIVSLISIF